MQIFENLPRSRFYFVQICRNILHKARILQMTAWIASLIFAPIFTDFINLQGPEKDRFFRKCEFLGIIICRGNTIGAQILMLLAVLIYVNKPLAPQYITGIFPWKTSIFTKMIGLMIDTYTKSVNIGQNFFYQAWFLFCVSYVTMSISVLR